MGLARFAGFDIPHDLMDYFVTMGGKLIRHPYQSGWNRPEETSRDQLVGYLAGAPKIWRKILDENYCMNVNKDILLPDVILYKKTLADKATILHKVFGYPFLILSIIYTCKVTPDHELNQLGVICHHMGKKWFRLLAKLHPDWENNILSYWNGWRNQPELGEALVRKFKENLV